MASGSLSCIPCPRGQPPPGSQMRFFHMSRAQLNTFTAKTEEVRPTWHCEISLPHSWQENIHPSTWPKRKMQSTRLRKGRLNCNGKGEAFKLFQLLHCSPFTASMGYMLSQSPQGKFTAIILSSHTAVSTDLSTTLHSALHPHHFL